MKTKNEVKFERPMAGGPSPYELRTALEVHTLAQMLYGQITHSHPWIAYGGFPPYGPVAMHEPQGPPWSPFPEWWR